MVLENKSIKRNKASSNGGLKVYCGEAKLAVSEGIAKGGLCN